MNRAETAGATPADATGSAIPAAGEALAVVRKALAHDSAVKHVSGTATGIEGG